MSDGYLSLLYSVSDKPLEYWSKKRSHTGCIRKILDSDLLENVVEIQDFEGSNATGTSISCPSNAYQLLDIKLPFLVIVVKNVKADCCFKVQVIDDKNVRHYFKFTSSDSEKESRIRNPKFHTVKLELQPDWNRVELDLRNFTQIAFGCRYLATQRIEICANCRLRRVYFIDKHYGENEISPELCQRFFDIYMLKWGSHLVDKTTQTFQEESSKSFKIRDPDTDETLDNENLNNVPEEFIKHVFIKSNVLVNGFINKRRSMIQYGNDFLYEIPTKYYVIPQIETHKKFIDTRNKINKEKSIFDSLRPFDHLKNRPHICVPKLFESVIKHRPQGPQDTKKKDTIEKWNHRYFHNAGELIGTNFETVPTDKVCNVEERKTSKKDVKSIHSDTKPLSAGSERKFLKRNSYTRKPEIKTLRLHSENPHFNAKYFVDSFNRQTVSTPYVKRDNLVQDTIFDLKRTYMNLINADSVVEAAKKYSIIIS